MTKKTAYKVNTEKKWIIIDDSVKQTKADQQDIALYLGAGYMIKHKSAAKSDQASGRAKTDTDASIKKALAGDAEARAAYEQLKSEKGFFSARKFYYEYVEEKKGKKKAAAGKAE